jgi:hypothetical protein
MCIDSYITDVIWYFNGNQIECDKGDTLSAVFNVISNVYRCQSWAGQYINFPHVYCYCLRYAFNVMSILINYNFISVKYDLSAIEHVIARISCFPWSLKNYWSMDGIGRSIGFRSFKLHMSYLPFRHSWKYENNATKIFYPRYAYVYICVPLPRITINPSAIPFEIGCIWDLDLNRRSRRPKIRINEIKRC